MLGSRRVQSTIDQSTINHLLGSPWAVIVKQKAPTIETIQPSAS